MDPGEGERTRVCGFCGRAERAAARTGRSVSEVRDVSAEETLSFSVGALSVCASRRRRWKNSELFKCSCCWTVSASVRACVRVCV